MAALADRGLTVRKLRNGRRALGVPSSPLEYPSLYPVTLTGERITLRELTTDDAPAAFVWGGDREWFAYMPFEAVASRRRRSGVPRCTRNRGT